jgi:hypothetical protein
VEVEVVLVLVLDQSNTLSFDSIFLFIVINLSIFQIDVPKIMYVQASKTRDKNEERRKEKGSREQLD